MSAPVVIPRDMLASATKRAFRSAGRNIRWSEARRRARIWCHIMLTGERPERKAA